MVCLDTSFLIDVLKGYDKVKDIERKIDSSSMSIAVAAPSVMELVSGAHLSNNPESENKKIEELLSSLVILSFDKESAILAGRIEAELLKSGQKIESEDVMIGAIVIKNNEVLLTRNKKHFERIKGLKIEIY